MGTNYNQLPIVVGLTGSEIFSLLQNGVDKRASISQLTGFSGGTTSQSANTIYAGPTTGAAAPPTFRALVSADIPSALVLGSGGVGSLGIGAGPVQASVQLAVYAQSPVPNLSAVVPGVITHIVGATGVNNTTVFDAIAQQNGVVFRRADGTVGSPTALLKDEVILNMTGRGWQGSNGYTQGGQGSADLEYRAAENWANGSAGGYMMWRTCTVGTLSSLYRIKLAQGLAFDAQVDTVSGLFATDPGPGIIASANGYLAGTSTQYAATSGTPVLQIHGTNVSTAAQSNTRWSADTNAAQNQLLKSRGAAIGTRGAVLSGDTMGNLIYGGDDGTNFIRAAQISGGVDGTVSTNIVPGRLSFFTTNTSGVSTEAMRIDSSQQVRIAQGPGGWYDVAFYGILPNGSDMTSLINSLLTTVYNAGGGVIAFRAGTYLINGQLVIPNDGTTTIFQTVSIRITGAGCYKAATGHTTNVVTTPPNGGTILDMRYSSTDAKLLTLGAGFLEVDNLNMMENGSAGTTTPFVLTTNTVLHFHDVAFFGFSSLSGTTCVQDCIILGGTSGSAGNTSSAQFQGYGTIIENCYGNRIRRFAYLRSACNSVIVRDNTIWFQSGSNLATGAAIEIDGTGSNADGNIIMNNLIEVNGYPYGIKVTVGTKNQLAYNAFWDENAAAPSLAYYRFESGTLYNVIYHGHGKTGGITVVSDANSAPTTNQIITAQSGVSSIITQPWQFLSTVAVGSGLSTPQGQVTISNNAAATLPTIQSGVMQVLAQIDSTSNGMEFQAFGSGLVAGNIVGKIAGGTAASLAATPSGSIFFTLNGFGYTGSAFASGAQLQLTAAELWASGHQGTNFKVQTTAIGTTARTNTFQIDGNFNVAVGATAAVSTSATNGWPYMVTSAGTPTGVPATTLGAMVPYEYDTTNNVLAVYNSGWKFASFGFSSAGVLPVANGGTNASSASITAFNNITGYTAAGASGTTSTNLVFSTSPTLTNLTLAAGTASLAPIVLTSGTNLTSAVAGGVEFDGVQHYHTIDTTSGRAAIPVEQYFHLNSDGGGITTIANFFGSTSNINLVASASYIIDIYMAVTISGAMTITWTFTNSAAPTSQNILYEQSPLAGASTQQAPLQTFIQGDATATKTITSGSLTTGTSSLSYHHFKFWLQNGTGTTFKIQATASANTITQKANSWWSCRRVSPNNIGTFAS